MNDTAFQAVGGKFDAVLLDCDGVLVDSVQLSQLAFVTWAQLLGVELEDVVRAAAGGRVVDFVGQLVTPDREDWAVAELLRLEMELAVQTRPCPGAVRLLDSLAGARWAIVTSGADDLCRARLAAAGLEAPEVLVAAEHVAHGKPAPDGFLQAAARLGTDPARCLAIDDGINGVKAAKAAGAVTWLLSPRAHPDHPGVRGLSDLVVRANGSSVTVTVSANE